MNEAQKLSFIIQYIIEEKGFDIRLYNKKKDKMGLRYAYYKVAHLLTSASLELIAKQCNRTHATVISSLNKEPDESWIEFTEHLEKVCRLAFGKAPKKLSKTKTALIHQLITLKAENEKLKKKPSLSLIETRIIDLFNSLNQTRKLELISNAETKFKIQNKFKTNENTYTRPVRGAWRD